MTIKSAFAAVLLTAAICVPVHADALRFSITEGQGQNSFLQDGPVAAHLMLSDGTAPRLIVAFPAGNSGAGLFFETTDQPVAWRQTAPMRPMEGPVAGVQLHGIQADLSVDSSALSIRRGDVGSLRFIRGAVDRASVADRPEIVPEVSGNKIRWARDGRYVLALEVLNGKAEAADGAVRLISDESALKLRLTALTGDTPLTPIARDRLLKPGAVPDERLAQALKFLAYKEKLLAGSWRFLTYFGRDTLLSLELMMPVLGPEAIEAGLGSVIDRINADGEVAHEEAIGELARLYNEKAHGKADDTPYYDYAMVDDNLMLLPVASHYLLGLSDEAARAFLARTTPGGKSYAERLALNAAYVVHIAHPFGAQPIAKNLIALKDGQVHGNWRDSEEGLARGRYPYDVNVDLMPAALRSIALLRQRGLLPGRAADAVKLAETWEREAVKPFLVTLPEGKAEAAVSAYADRLGVPVVAAGVRSFAALALDADGKAIPVEHSDEGFGLMFGLPDRAALNRALGLIETPFPAGLMSPVGLMVANPVYADADTGAIVGAGNYHGTVVWSWQQAMWVVGLRRQEARGDLDAALKARLKAAECRLWQAIDATAEVRNSELWSWDFRDGAYHVAPFGQRAGDITESNAVQLWSTVYLGLARPKEGFCSE